MQRRKYALLKQPFELDALGDVSLTNPILGDGLVFDGTNWVNGPVSVSDEDIDDRVAALLVAGNNIDITYNDGANTLTIDVESLTAADITDFSEAVDDRLNALIVPGNNIDVTYDDALNTFTISVEALTSADISDFTEAAQDAVGSMVSATGVGVDLVYSDATPSLTANLDISGLTEDTTPDTAADYIVTYDASATTHKKVLLDNLGLGGGGGGSSTPVNDGVQLTRTTGQSIAITSTVYLQWTVETRDDNNYFDSGSNTRITIPETGWYAFGCYAEWPSAGGIYLQTHLNGTRIAYEYKPASPGSTYASHVRYLTAGDYIEFSAYHDGVGTISLVGPGTVYPQAWCHRLGTSTPTHAQRYERMFDFDDEADIPGDTNSTWERGTGGAGASVSYAAADATHFGIITLTTGTDSAGYAELAKAPSLTSANRRYLLGTDAINIECLFRAPTLPDGTDTFFLAFGLRDTNSFVERVSCGFRWTGSACRWRMNNTAASTTSGADAATGPTANTWHHLRLRATSSGCELFADGVSVGTLNTNVPTLGMNLFLYVGKTAGTTSRTVDIDFVKVWKEFSSNRYTG